jgi:hypothetical protein
MDRREFLAGGAGLLAASAVRGDALPQNPAPREKAGRMHLGIVTYNIANKWDLPTILKVCREAGIEGVEFRTTHAHGVEPSLDAGKRREVRQKCQDAGLLQTSLGTVCEFHSPDAAVVQKNIADCRAFIQLAHDIGARGVKVRPNGLPEGVPPEKTFEQIGKALAECGKFAAEHGVEIWMEVHGKDTQLAPNSRKIMDACGHPSVGVTWNCNPTDVVNGSVQESFALLGGFIKCCHITELWSDYPYREFFGLLKQHAYDRFTLCEIGAGVLPEDGVTFLRCYKGLWRELQRG